MTGDVVQADTATVASTVEVWEFEHEGLPPLSGGEKVPFWMAQADKRSVSRQARKPYGTGRIRSYTRTVTETAPVEERVRPTSKPRMANVTAAQ